MQPVTASSVSIGGREVGPGRPVFFIAEIGINHNGDVGLAKKLIGAAASAGCDAVKFQKRTVDVVYSRRSWRVRARAPSARRTAT